MGGVNGHTAQAFVETSPRSWAESDIKGPVDIREGVVQRRQRRQAGPGHGGRRGIGGARVSPRRHPSPARRTRRSRKRAWSCSATRISPRRPRSAFQGNRDLFMNTIGWLSQQENLIAIRPKEPDDRRVTMTAAQQNNVTVLSLLFIPGLRVRRGRLQLVAEAIDARTADHHRTCRRSRGAVRLHLLRHVEAAGRRHRTETGESVRRARGRQNRRASGHVGIGRHQRAQERQGRLAPGRARRERGGRLRSVRHHVGAVPARDRARRRREPGQPERLRSQLAPDRNRLQGDRRQGLQASAHRPEISHRRQPLRQTERREARLSDSRVSGADLQSSDVRSPRQGGPSLRSGQGRPHRDRRRRQNPGDRQDRQRLEPHEAGSGGVRLLRRRGAGRQGACRTDEVGGGRERESSRSQEVRPRQTRGDPHPGPREREGHAAPRRQGRRRIAVRPRRLQAARHDARQLAGRRASARASTSIAARISSRSARTMRTASRSRARPDRSPSTR